MSRFFIFLLGVLVGAAAVFYLFKEGTLSLDSNAPRPAQTTSAGSVPPADGALQPPPYIPPPTAVTPEITDDPTLQPPPLVIEPLSPSAGDGPATVAPQAGPLLIPVAGVVAAQLSDTYTQTRSEGRVHEAIDIMAPRGTQVLAADDGRVVKLFNSKQGGLTAYQYDRSEKFAYYYAHLDSYAPGVAEGKLLKRGELVGYVGSTGNANPSAPHLHFAVFVLGPEKNWWKGTAINPYPLLVGPTTLVTGGG